MIHDSSRLKCFPSSLDYFDGHFGKPYLATFTYKTEPFEKPSSGLHQDGGRAGVIAV